MSITRRNQQWRRPKTRIPVAQMRDISIKKHVFYLYENPRSNNDDHAENPRYDETVTTLRVEAISCCLFSCSEHNCPSYKSKHTSAKELCGVDVSVHVTLIDLELKWEGYALDFLFYARRINFDAGPLGPW